MTWRPVTANVSLLLLLGGLMIAALRAPFTTISLLEDLVGEHMPADLLGRLTEAPLHQADPDPVPGLLTVARDGRRSPARVRHRGLTAERVAFGPWGATYALPDGEDPRDWAVHVRNAEPIWEREINGVLPNDPGVTRQWHLLGLDLPRIRGRATGEGVVVAVIDTGVTAGEDGPAHVLRGVDLVYDQKTTEDLNGHGSMVAALIAQSTDNHMGFASLAPDARILPIRACDEAGRCRSDRVAAGIYAALNLGAKVINLSVSGSQPSEVEAHAIHAATRTGVIVVASAGNDHGPVGWPAASPEVIAVGATDRRGNVAPYSNRGPEIDFWAPGGDAASPLEQEAAHGEDRAWGTSFAAPLVSASIALGISLGMTAEETVHRLRVAGTAEGNLILYAAVANSPLRPMRLLDVMDVSTPASDPDVGQHQHDGGDVDGPIVPEAARLHDDPPLPADVDEAPGEPDGGDVDGTPEVEEGPADSDRTRP